MNGNDLKKVSYEDLYDFICETEDIDDFVNRLKIMSSKITEELKIRFDDTKPVSVLKMTELIDIMNEEVVCLVKRINDTDLLNGQPRIMENLLFGILSIYNFDLVLNYNYSKTIMLN